MKFALFKKKAGILWAINAATPKSEGFVPPKESIGKSGDKGFDFGITYSNNPNDFTYQVGLNGGYTKDRIIFWDENQNVPEYQFSIAGAIIWCSFWGTNKYTCHPNLPGR